MITSVDRSQLVRNLGKLYRRATDADIVSGEGWYPYARSIVRDWAGSYCLPDRTVANVIAAISPQCRWEDNLIIADDVLAGRPPSIHRALPRNVSIARRLIAEASFEQQLTSYMPYGPKVACFAENLVGSDHYVTVDTHALQAALADPTSTIALKWSRYLVFAQAYVIAAERAHRLPAEYQAILWHTWKRLHPAGEKRWLKKRKLSNWRTH